MPRITQLPYICWLFLAATGCESKSPPANPTPGGAPTIGVTANSPPPPAPPPQARSSAETPSGASSTGEQGTRDQAVTAPGKPSRKVDIRLSTGVALAQTGLDGTLMSFSVDFEFTATTPASGASYALVVQRRDGQTVMNQQMLLQSGNLALLVPGWRGEDGPFHGYIVELNTRKEPVAQSESIELTAP